MKIWFQFIFAMLLIAFSVSTFAAQNARYGRVIVFGDSLSDVGTYRQVAAIKGGGKFTTNPGKLWVEFVAAQLNLPMGPNRMEGFGFPVRVLNGFNYAQGGSRIVLPWNQQGTEVQTLTARPLAEQVGLFLTKYDRFNADDLILIQGGANDIFAQASAVRIGKLTPEQALANAVQAANDLSLIVQKIKNTGGQHLLVMNLPAIEKTPKILTSNAAAQALVKNLVAAFNLSLAKLMSPLNVINVDVYTADLYFNDHATDYGIKDITHPGCLTKSLPLESSLFCSSKSLVEKDADLTYKFADDIHPATGYSKYVGDLIFSQIPY